MLASSALDLAEYYAYTRKFGRALNWLSRALILDPVRSALFVAYRLARSARRKLGPAVPITQSSHFLDADPSTCIHADPYRLNRFAELLRNIDLRRLERLAEEDKRADVERG